MLSVATASATTVVVAAEQIAQCAVLPHCVDERDKNGGAATRKYAFKTVFGTACGYEQENEYPKAAVAASELRKNIHKVPPVNVLQGGMYSKNLCALQFSLYLIIFESAKKCYFPAQTLAIVVYQ